MVIYKLGGMMTGLPPDINWAERVFINYKFTKHNCPNLVVHIRPKYTDCGTIMHYMYIDNVLRY